MTSLFRRRDFALLWTGETVSSLGTSITLVALPLLALGVLHATPLQVGVLSAAGSIGWLLIGLPAGVWADRIRRRPLMIATDLARAAVLVTVPVAWWLGHLTLVQLFVVALLLGLFSVVFDVAYPAYLPTIVERDRLVEGNGHLQAGALAAWIAGSPLAGAMIQVLGAPVALLVDTVSYLVSAVCLAAVRAVETVVDPARRQSLRTELAAGVRYVLANPITRAIAFTVPVANFVFAGYEAVVVVFLYREVRLTAAVIGFLLMASGVGGVAGAFLAGRLAKVLGDARLIWISAVVTAGTGLLLPLTSRGPGLAWFAVGSFGIDFGVACFNVCVISTIQSMTPQELIGRTTASIRLFTRSALPLGALAGGALASALSARTALAVLMGLLLVVPVRLRLAFGSARSTTDLPAPR